MTTLAFLFTDIEGSTRMWEADAPAMREALAAHDEVMRTAVETHGGSLFKHTGDGICAAFTSPRAAIEAAIAAQRSLSLRVRMAVVCGEAHQRGDDYFGPTLNRAARVMNAGHGGQILVDASIPILVQDLDLIDLGEHRLRDLRNATHLYQVTAEGLDSTFPPLRTQRSAAVGNLQVDLTSFVGREQAMEELAALVRSQRLVTLTGVGGVGKTRLATQVGAALAEEQPDGVWVVELAPVTDPDAVPDAVATVLGVTPDRDLSVVDSVGRALAGRHLLLVLDNCEHVLPAAGAVAQAILRQAPSVRLVATSREALGIPGEQVWPVPTLAAHTGPSAPAVQLFVQRAQAVRPGFDLHDPDEAAAVEAVCHALDGVALAIELAAARMVSMSARELYDHLGERFRLLAGGTSGPEHHHTLRRTVAWSYDLLSDTERRLLDGCSVFADGFEVGAALAVAAPAGADTLEVLDLLDSLVRKSLVTVERVAGQTRYGLLETIRQFGEEQLTDTGELESIRRRHAAHFAEAAAAAWEKWNGPDQRASLDWVDRELSNLRAGFRWALANAEPELAAVIAAHSAMLAFALQRFEPVSWAEEILPAARHADLAILPRVLTAAGVCALTGRPELAVAHTEEALELRDDPRYDPFDLAWTRAWQASGYRYVGRIDRWVEISQELAGGEGLAKVVGLTFLGATLPALGRADEARATADEAVARARDLHSPFWICFAMEARARTVADTDPGLAMEILDEVLDYARAQRLAYFETNVMRELAGLEALLGRPDDALELLDDAIAAYQRAGNHGSVASTLGQVAATFATLGRREVAATVYGTSTRFGIGMIARLPEVLEQLRADLGADAFDRRVGAGAAMEFDVAMDYVRSEIALVRRQLAAES